MQDPAALKPEILRDAVNMSSERNWPKNNWWVIAHASELTDKPLGRWALEMPVVIFRKQDGSIGALIDRCPHRWAPLSMGMVKDDKLICGYHGMAYDDTGQCVNVPSQPRTPSAIRVGAFTAVERYGFIWLWTGERADADPTLIPEELAFLDQPGWHSVWGYKSVNGNYMQIKENVLDLTHFAYLHAQSLGVPDWDKAPAVEVTDRYIKYRQDFPMSPLAKVYAVPAAKEPGKPVDRTAWGCYITPALNMGAVDMHDPSPEPNGLENFALRVMHLTTPVSSSATHYFWMWARDHGEPYDVEAYRAFVSTVFDEDVSVINATADICRRASDQDEATEFSVAADRAAVETRRRVAEIVARERASAD